MTDPAVPASARTVVLVHGAWHGAWCYAALQAELDRRGVPSLAVDLPGHGVSLAPLTDLHGDARCVADTLAMLGQRGVENPVLVGHSYGGAVITQAAVWFPAVAHLVYLAAFALDDGESVMGALRAFPRHDVALSAAMRPLDDGTSVLDPAVAGAALYGSCPAEVVAPSLARTSRWPRCSRRWRARHGRPSRRRMCCARRTRRSTRSTSESWPPAAGGPWSW